MIKALRYLSSSFIIALIASFSLFGVASAWNPFSGVDCSGRAANSTVCKDKGGVGTDPIAGSDGIIMAIVNFIAVIGGIAAIIIIVLAGLRFVTAGGSSEDISGARRTIIYAAIGLIVIALARTIVAFIITRL